MRKWKANIYFIAAAFCCFVLSCKKDQISTSSSHKLSFSLDTLYFDTVFSTIGTSTKIFKVYNPNSQKVNISTIELSDQATQYFRCNVNGLSGTKFSDVELRAEDSLWVFVEVTVDPSLNPQFLELWEKMNFVTNGNEQHITLQAYPLDIEIHSAEEKGQDFYLTQNETWTNDKAHLVYGMCHVDSSSVLTVEKGTRVHFASGAGLSVEKGSSLMVNGEVDEIVRFEGMRLESWYEFVKGQWKGVYLQEGSVDHTFDALHMNNSTDGLYCAAEKLSNSFALTATNCEFNGSLYNGVTFDNSSAELLNVEVLNNGANGIEINGGKEYEFYHVTAANFGSASESAFTNSVLSLSSLTSEDDEVGVNNITIANSIIDGDLTNEFEILGDESTINYEFLSCAIKLSNQDNDGEKFDACLFNKNGDYIDTAENDYSLDEESDFLNAGDGSLNDYNVILDKDKTGVSRSLTTPDLGARESVN